MKLNDLKPATGSKKSRRRVGRGLGSGRGKTAGRGQKGQSSRSGFSQGAGWEGGRSRLIMRLPKRGFNKEKEQFQLINLGDLNAFEEGATVSAETLKERGFIRYANKPVKLLGRGELEVKKLQVDVDAFSRNAAQAVIAAGGTVRGADEAQAEEPAAKGRKKKAPAKSEENAASAGAESAAEAGATEKPEADAKPKASAKEKAASKEKKADVAEEKKGKSKAGAAGSSKAKAAESGSEAQEPAADEAESASEDSSGEEQA